MLDFVFLLRLRDVAKISSLAELIIEQHDQFNVKDIEHLTAILQGKIRHRVLLILDGYDEYSPGTNSDIDKAIDSTAGKCLIILMSRPGYLKQNIRTKMDGEIMAHGFSEENIRKCSIVYLGCDKKTQAMLKQAEKSGFNELLHLPILLLITCVIFLKNGTLPKTQTEIFRTVYELIMDRTTLKRIGCKSSELTKLDDLLFALGKFSWKSLSNTNFPQLLLNKVMYPDKV